MNILFTGIIIFVITFLLLSWFARANSKKVAKGARSIIILLSLILAIILAVGGRILFSLPLFLLAMSALKIKGLTAIQIFQLWRLLNYLRSSGRFSYYGRHQAAPSSSLTLDEAYKVLGIKRGCSKEEVIKAANNLQKKIHPDVNKDANTERLSQIVNESKQAILKHDFT
ncbi:MAG: DnaJ domain-containing protein [Pelagibacteraceae bacterium]|jgi:hypothetical protein|nr:molecular chaperone DnaJ [Candidatus Pelagibacter sp.]MDP6681280.1 DnaJ domain-containing protein [Pelagibacteraceae bacterium]MDP6710152.1 DnaJ domain-containing protein [Pelagibacteraceae bacterium]|tara:strand:- start:109 stop:618 length:510 start_codon:yes stop_codon:yes gene_type:complete